MAVEFPVTGIRREAVPGEHFVWEERFNERSGNNLLKETVGNFIGRRVQVPPELTHRVIWFGRYTAQTTDDQHVTVQGWHRGSPVFELPADSGTVQSLPFTRFNVFTEQEIAFGNPESCADSIYWNPSATSAIPMILRPFAFYAVVDEILEYVYSMPKSIAIFYSTFLAVRSNRVEPIV